jgi:predicted nucleic acid-binding Zn ribbon protein
MIYLIYSSVTKMLRIPASGKYKGRRDYVKKEPHLVRCDVCGTEFRAKRVDARACSGRCRKLRHLRRLGQLSGPRPVHQVTCEVCLAQFESRRSDARTCSARCRKALSRSPIGHLDRLERVIKNLDEAEARKKWKETDKVFRDWHRHAATPMTYRQKTEWAAARRWRQWKAENKHLKNVLEAIERREGSSGAP